MLEVTFSFDNLNLFKSAIASSNCVVLLVTKDCFKAKEHIEEDWFLEEIRTAISLGKKIIPILFDKIESLSDSSIMAELNKNFNARDIEIIVKSQSVPYSTDFPDASITKLVHFIEEANEKYRDYSYKDFKIEVAKPNFNAY